MKTHVLKIDKSYADAKLSGLKPWEFRRNDRDFKAGDFVYYKVNGCREHPLEDNAFKIIYVLNVGAGMCVFTDINEGKAYGK